MVQANELRLGNLLKYNEEIVEVIKIFGSHLEVHSDVFQFWTDEINEFNQIPLTEEILLKLGAKELIKLNDGYKRFNLDAIHLSISPERDYFIEYVHQIPIKYLHTFQNFVFATKTKELNVDNLL